MNRVLLIDKPADWTSFDVVAKIRSQLTKQITDDPAVCDCGACKQELERREQGVEPRRPHRLKVGHAGTLDPFATGLLIVLVGKATKRQDEFMGLTKTYEATIKLGATTETLDPESDEQFVSDRQPTTAEIEQSLDNFKGEIEQIPPKFSALKVNGRRAYDLARKGKAVTLKPRTITVHSLELLDYKYPELKIRTEVSKGTYIRTLAEDIGDELDVGGYCLQLRRTTIGEILVDDADLIDNII
jgi:tRNA pseudouridine55 synthase